MTAAERKTLEQVASEFELDARLHAGQTHHAAECRSRAAAIRAAIAEVDRLRADLTAVMGEVQRIQPEGSPPPFGLPFHAKWCVDAALAEADRLAAENADLRARAIPTRLVSADLLSIVADFNDRVETITRTVTPKRTGWIHDIDPHDGRPSVLSPAFPTLAAALEAAAKGSK